MTYSNVLLAASLAVAAGCSADVHTVASSHDGDGGEAPYASGGGGSSGSGGAGAASGGASASGGNVTSGGSTSTGGSTASGGTSSASGGTTSTGTGGGSGSGSGGAAARCTNCWLLAENVEWARFYTFTTDGTRIVWQDAGSGYSLHTMAFDGTDSQSFIVQPCSFRWVSARVFDGYIYFNDLYRIAVGFTKGTMCEHKWTSSKSLQSFYIDAARNVFWGSVADSPNYVPNQLVRIAYPSFGVQVESDPNDIVVQAADTQALFGRNNPQFGSASNNILRYDITTKTTTVLHGALTTGGIVTVDGTSVYYAQSENNYVKVPKDAPSTDKPTVISGPDMQWSLQLDGDQVVYWKLGDTHLYSMPVAGGPPKDVSLGAFKVRGLTFDATRYFVMVSDNLDGPFKLLRVAR